MISFKAELIEIGTIGVLVRLASLSGMGLLIFGLSYSVKIASTDSIDEISDGLKHVRLKSMVIAFLFIIIYHLFGEYTLSQWGLSSDLKLPLMLLVGAQIINSACGPVGIIMAKYGQFMRLIGYAFLSLILFATCLFITPLESIFITVSIGVLIMQFLENILKLTWWNNYKKRLI